MKKLIIFIGLLYSVGLFAQVKYVPVIDDDLDAVSRLDSLEFEHLILTGIPEEDDPDSVLVIQEDTVKKTVVVDVSKLTTQQLGDSLSENAQFDSVRFSSGFTIIGVGDSIYICKSGVTVLVLYDDSVILRDAYFVADSFLAVSRNTYADYVFEKGYKYMSIDEQIEYAFENGFLEGMGGVAKNGNIARRQEAMVRKLEELYLIVHEQNKMIEKLKKRKRRR